MKRTGVKLAKGAQPHELRGIFHLIYSSSVLIRRSVEILPVTRFKGAVRAMRQTLRRDIRECYLRAEQCRRLAEGAPTPSARAEFLDMERRWLSFARSYEFAERLSNFTEPFRTRKHQKA